MEYSKNFECVEKSNDENDEKISETNQKHSNKYDCPDLKYIGNIKESSENIKFLNKIFDVNVIK